MHVHTLTHAAIPLKTMHAHQCLEKGARTSERRQRTALPCEPSSDLAGFRPSGGGGGVPCVL